MGQRQRLAGGYAQLPPPWPLPASWCWPTVSAAATPSGALASAGIGPAVIGDPRARLTSLPFERLCAHAMRELDDEALGWFARRLPWGCYGMLACASFTAAQLGLALARKSRSTQGKPALPLTPHTWRSPCGVTKWRCAPCCSAPCA
ncbi:MAG: AraC family transcriptional regulator ligand-binding domain-containing protein [Tepidimonas sp.]|nr:AraC family transcriptional regulator ligand-binding domain-containing protein [Tepidimonas sp.]